MTTTQILNEGQKMIYGRKRIMDTFYKTHPVGKDILEEDIQGITFDDDHVLLHVEGKDLRIHKSKVIRNFWEHRTRTPSYFDYRIWRERPQEGGNISGVPIAAIDHEAEVNKILMPVLGRPFKISTDKDGTKRIYFITPVDKACSCGSYHYMKENEDELAAEFKKYCPDIDFKPCCKHIKWYEKQILLFTDIQLVQARYGFKCPRLCIYQHDHSRRKILYRITNDGEKVTRKWLPKDGWKEKDLCDSSGMPTGHCWSVLEGAMAQNPPYKLIPYSPSVEAMMNRSSYPKSRS